MEPNPNTVFSGAQNSLFLTNILNIICFREEEEKTLNMSNSAYNYERSGYLGHGPLVEMAALECPSEGEVSNFFMPVWVHLRLTALVV